MKTKKTIGIQSAIYKAHGLGWSAVCASAVTKTGALVISRGHKDAKTARSWIAQKERED